MKDRRGFALVAAIVCIVLISVMVTGALFSGSQEAHASRTAILEEQATAYAERAARRAISTWDCPACDSLTVGAVIVQNPTADPPLESTVYTTRLDSALFLVVAEGRVMASGASRLKRRIAIAVRISRDSSGLTRAFPLDSQSWSAVYTM